MPRTLKHRLILLLLLCSLFPLLLIGSISYSSMYSMLKNKAERGITGNLRQVRLSFENTLSQLNYASQQLVFEGEIGNKLDAYLDSSTDLFGKRQLGQQIQSEISLIHFTNPALGVIFYYLSSTGEIIFPNGHVHPDVRIFEHPLLAKQLAMTYYGPHLSVNPLNGNNVLSVIRKVNLPSRDDVYLYIETDFKFTDRILNSDGTFRDTYYLFVDREGRIAYSEKNDVFPIGSRLARFTEHSRSYRDYYLFQDVSNQSWSIVAAIPKASYNQEIREWFAQFAVIATLSILIGCLLAFAIWRMVYTPLLQLQRNIRRLKNGRLSDVPDVERQSLVEFAEIHHEFSNMKQRIDQLIEDINRNAQSRRKLEVEMLMSKINPHFIHNTLDTIRWQAKVNGHHETDLLVSTLNKLLHYNLGKGRTACIRDEIEALKHYVLLQSVRYNFRFEVHLDAPAELLDLPVPRFILQPLVENSLSHGLKNKRGGVIEVSVRQQDDARVVIEVRDNGYGMTEEEVRRMLSDDGDPPRPAGMGIGWRYVQKMLDHHYEGKAKLTVDSGPDKGTTISLNLPMEPKGEMEHVERDGR